MLKILVTVILLNATGMAFAAELTPFEKDASIRTNDVYDEDQLRKLAVIGAEMAHLRGWKCDSISSFSPFVFSRGFTLNCNGFRYTYELLDKGGNWVIELK